MICASQGAPLEFQCLKNAASLIANLCRQVRFFTLNRHQRAWARRPHLNQTTFALNCQLLSERFDEQDPWVRVCFAGLSQASLGLQSVDQSGLLPHKLTQRKVSFGICDLKYSFAFSFARHVCIHQGCVSTKASTGPRCNTRLKIVACLVLAVGPNAPGSWCVHVGKMKLYLKSRRKPQKYFGAQHQATCVASWGLGPPLYP